MHTKDFIQGGFVRVSDSCIIVDWDLHQDITGDEPYPVQTQEEVDPETVGQFTGLLDKNGAKIFEGDIVKADWGKTPMTIIWNESDFWWEASVTPEYGGWCLDDLNPCEVIGNIHENPELLEVSH